MSAATPTRDELDRLAQRMNDWPLVAVSREDRERIRNLLRAYPLHAVEDDPRDAPQPVTYAPPIVVEKHRHRMDGSEAISFYACGPVRASVAEAMADARAFVPLPAVEGERAELAERLRSGRSQCVDEVYDRAAALLVRPERGVSKEAVLGLLDDYDDVLSEIIDEQRPEWNDFDHARARLLAAVRALPEAELIVKDQVLRNGPGQTEEDKP